MSCGSLNLLSQGQIRQYFKQVEGTYRRLRSFDEKASYNKLRPHSRENPVDGYSNKQEILESSANRFVTLLQAIHTMH